LTTEQADVPVLTVPGMVVDRDVAAVEQDFQEPGRGPPGVARHQRCARVQAELSGDVVRPEGPCGMDVAAAKKMRPDPREPASDFPGIDQPLPCEFTL